MTVGFLVEVEARPDKVDETVAFLEAAPAMVEKERGLTSWCVSRTGPTTFVSFNSFVDDGARQEHLAGELATALAERADELFAAPPTVVPHEVLAQVLPAGK